MALSEDWKVSSFTGANSCVQVRNRGPRIEVRNSNDPNGPSVFYSKDEWGAFIKGAKAGEFDLSE